MGIGVGIGVGIGIGITTRGASGRKRGDAEMQSSMFASLRRLKINLCSASESFSHKPE